MGPWQSGVPGTRKPCAFGDRFRGLQPQPRPAGVRTNTLTLATTAMIQRLWRRFTKSSYTPSRYVDHEAASHLRRRRLVVPPLSGIRTLLSSSESDDCHLLNCHSNKSKSG